MTDTEMVSENLYRIPPTHRRRMALTLAPLGLVLLVAGIVMSLRDGIGWKLVGVVVAVLAVLLLGIAWGLRRSAALTEAAEADARLDEAIIAATGPCGESCKSAEADSTGARNSTCFSGSGLDCANCLTRTTASDQSLR